MKLITDTELENDFRTDKVIIILYSDVYDLTTFNHPGGNFLKQYSGTNATKIFTDMKHEEKHIKLIEKYKIGKYNGDMYKNVVEEKVCRLEEKEVDNQVSNTILFTFSTKEKIIAGKHHVYLFTSIDNEIITRPYTPINSYIGHDKNVYFTLLIKISEFGKMTQHLLKMKINDSIKIATITDFELQCLKYKFTYKNILYKNYYDNIVFVAVGTGITPIFNLAREITNHSKMKVTLVHCIKTSSNKLITSKLKELKNINIIYNKKDTDGYFTTEKLNKVINKNSFVITCGSAGLSTLNIDCLFYHFDNYQTNLNTENIEIGKRKLEYNRVGYYDNFAIRNVVIISIIYLSLNCRLITLKMLFKSFLFSQMLFIIHNVSHHRNLSHKSFEFRNETVSNLFNIIGSLVTFKSGSWYAIHHRKHHLICDDEEQNDPYGGYYSGKDYSLRWFVNEIDFNKHHDFNLYPEFNTRFHKLQSYTENFIFPIWVGSIIILSNEKQWQTNLITYCFVPICLNIIYIFLQTIPHLYPDKIPSKGKCHPSNPFICGILTGGEGYHGNHHDYQRSSKIGRKIYQIDTGYILIWCLEKIKLVYNVIIE